MILSRQCTCGHAIEFEAEDLAELTCENCGRSLQEQFAPPKPPPPRFDAPDPAPQFQKVEASFEQPTVQLAKLPTQSTLEAVRQQSCYEALRGLIDTIFACGIGVIILTGIATIVALAMSQRPESAIGAIVIVAFLLLCGVVLVALKQAMLLGVDAVDIMIANRTDRANSAGILEPRNGATATVDK